MDSFPPQPEKELKEILDDLLREKNVSSTASWEYALKLIGNDSRYELFRHHPERKQMFNNYKIQKSKEEKEEQRSKTKKARENLEKMLHSNDKMNSSVRYRQAADLFALNEAWKAVADNDRREIFREVVEQMAVREREAHKCTRKKNMKVLADILNGMTAVSHRTKWAEAQQLLLDNAVFAEDSELLAMDKEDALIVFEDHIRDLEKDEDEERHREKCRLYRTQRKNREAFVQLLDNMHRQGKLTSASKWSALYPEISTDSRFAAMLSQPLSGSTALDLFKFYVEDLRNKYEDDKELVRDILKKQAFHTDIGTTFEHFEKAVRSDERSKDVVAANLKCVFERSLAKAREKEKERLKVEAKKKKRLESAFIDLLHSLKPAVDENADWNHVRTAIADEEAFAAIVSEEERMQLFKLFMETMLETCSHHHSKSKKKSGKKKEQKRRSISPSVSSDSGREAGVDYEDGEEKEGRVRRRSRSSSPYDGLKNSGLRERSSRRSESHSSSSESERRAPPHRSRSRSVSERDATGAAACNTERRETESEASDIEELEKQRQLLLSQLAAANANH